MNQIIMNKTGVIGHKLYNKNKKIDSIKSNLRYILGQWNTIETGDTMNKDIKKCINLILSEQCCKEVVYFEDENMSKLWIILDEDNFDTNMLITNIIEDCLAFNSVELEYLFFDESEKKEIEDQLGMMSVSVRSFNEDGR